MSFFNALKDHLVLLFVCMSKMYGRWGNQQFNAGYTFPSNGTSYVTELSNRSDDNAAWFIIDEAYSQ